VGIDGDVLLDEQSSEYFYDGMNLFSIKLIKND